MPHNLPPLGLSTPRSAKLRLGLGGPTPPTSARSSVKSSRASAVGSAKKTPRGKPPILPPGAIDPVAVRVAFETFAVEVVAPSNGDLEPFTNSERAPAANGSTREPTGQDGGEMTLPCALLIHALEAAMPDITPSPAIVEDEIGIAEAGAGCLTFEQFKTACHRCARPAPSARQILEAFRTATMAGSEVVADTIMTPRPGAASPTSQVPSKMSDEELKETSMPAADFLNLLCEAGADSFLYEQAVATLATLDPEGKGMVDAPTVLAALGLGPDSIPTVHEESESLMTAASTAQPQKPKTPQDEDDVLGAEAQKENGTNGHDNKTNGSLGGEGGKNGDDAAAAVAAPTELSPLPPSSGRRETPRATKLAHSLPTATRVVSESPNSSRVSDAGTQPPRRRHGPESVADSDNSGHSSLRHARAVGRDRGDLAPQHALQTVLSPRRTNWAPEAQGSPGDAPGNHADGKLPAHTVVGPAALTPRKVALASGPGTAASTQPASPAGPGGAPAATHVPNLGSLAALGGTGLAEVASPRPKSPSMPSKMAQYGDASAKAAQTPLRAETPRVPGAAPMAFARSNSGAAGARTATPRVGAPSTPRLPPTGPSSPGRCAKGASTFGGAAATEPQGPDASPGSSKKPMPTRPPTPPVSVKGKRHATPVGAAPPVAPSSRPGSTAGSLPGSPTQPAPPRSARKNSRKTSARGGSKDQEPSMVAPLQRVQPTTPLRSSTPTATQIRAATPTSTTRVQRNSTGDHETASATEATSVKSTPAASSRAATGREASSKDGTEVTAAKRTTSVSSVASDVTGKKFTRSARKSSVRSDTSAKDSPNGKAGTKATPQTLAATSADDAAAAKSPQKLEAVVEAGVAMKQGDKATGADCHDEDHVDASDAPAVVFPDVEDRRPAKAASPDPVDPSARRGAGGRPAGQTRAQRFLASQPAAAAAAAARVASPAAGAASPEALPPTAPAATVSEGSTDITPRMTASRSLEAVENTRNASLSPQSLRFQQRQRERAARGKMSCSARPAGAATPPVRKSPTVIPAQAPGSAPNSRESSQAPSRAGSTMRLGSPLPPGEGRNASVSPACPQRRKSPRVPSRNASRAGFTPSNSFHRISTPLPEVLAQRHGSYSQHRIHESPAPEDAAAIAAKHHDRVELDDSLVFHDTELAAAAAVAAGKQSDPVERKPPHAGPLEEVSDASPKRHVVKTFRDEKAAPSVAGNATVGSGDLSGEKTTGGEQHNSGVRKGAVVPPVQVQKAMSLDGPLSPADNDRSPDVSTVSVAKKKEGSTPRTPRSGKAKKGSATPKVLTPRPGGPRTSQQQPEHKNEASGCGHQPHGEERRDESPVRRRPNDTRNSAKPAVESHPSNAHGAPVSAVSGSGKPSDGGNGGSGAATKARSPTPTANAQRKATTPSRTTGDAVVSSPETEVKTPRRAVKNATPRRSGGATTPLRAGVGGGATTPKRTTGATTPKRAGATTPKRAGGAHATTPKRAGGAATPKRTDGSTPVRRGATPRQGRAGAKTPPPGHRHGDRHGGGAGRDDPHAAGNRDDDTTDDHAVPEDRTEDNTAVVGDRQSDSTVANDQEDQGHDQVSADEMPRDSRSEQKQRNDHSAHKSHDSGPDDGSGEAQPEAEPEEATDSKAGVADGKGGWNEDASKSGQRKERSGCCCVVQ